jgi:hypothetical protein
MAPTILFIKQVVREADTSLVLGARHVAQIGEVDAADMFHERGIRKARDRFSSLIICSPEVA